MNFKLEGYNECLITYVIAVSSPTHPISATAYHKAWARNGSIVSGALICNSSCIDYNGASGNVKYFGLIIPI
jgi:hypothetical protein